MTADFPGSDTAVVILHGLTGSPVSMRPLAEACAAAELGVRMPLLPGHGTTWQDLNRYTYSDWVAAAQSALDEARASYRNVYVCGLSMGGTVALELAVANPDVSGVSVINPALLFDDPRMVILPVLKHAVPSAAAIADDIAKPGVTEEAYPRTPLKALHTLDVAARALRSRLWEITCPVQVFASAADHVVSTRAPQLVFRHVSSQRKRMIVLHRSYHVATLDYDSEIISAGLVDFAGTGRP